MTPDRDWLLVSETFKTLQGEGPSTGQPAFFIRLGACNLHCSWCDTPYTWAFDSRHAQKHSSRQQYDPKIELNQRKIISLVTEVIESGVGLAVITGGEPLLQLPGVASLMSSVNEFVGAPRFEVETAGTIAPGELLRFTNTYFNVSPKLESSGNEVELRYKREVLKDFAETGRARFKFVIDTRDQRRSAEDFVEMQCIIADCHLNPRDVWLMPCGTSNQEITDGLRELADLVIKFNYNLTGRQHVTIWGDTRGR
jgi:organic radical activating enzyme